MFTIEMETEHFTETEFIASQIGKAAGIDNEVPLYLRNSMLLTLSGLERIRSALGFSIDIHSGYRCEALNKLVGGSVHSQHMKAEAVDFVCPSFGTPRDICKFLEAYVSMIGIDQLIMEGTWVHVSFNPFPRNQVLTFKDGKYLEGVV